MFMSVLPELRYKIDVLNRHLDPRDKLPSEGKILDILLFTCTRNGRWHDMNCIKGHCNSCHGLIKPIEKLCDLIMEVEGRWAHWERQATERGTKLDVFLKSGCVSDLLKEMEKDLEQPVRGTSFLEHLFTAYWQQDQFRYLLNTLMPGEAFMVEDFDENRKATYSSEVKSAYFSNQQITLHPIVAYYKSADFQLVRHALMYVSDDICHDHHLVNHFTLDAIEYLKSETLVMWAYIFSDGCAGQYKGMGTFTDLSLVSGIKVQRAFYGSDHGKREANGETGGLSQALQQHVKAGNNISCAKDPYSWASLVLGKHEDLQRRTFFLVPVSDVNRTSRASDVHTVPGTRKMHQIEQVDDYVIKTRSLACFCCACRSGNTALCINRQYMGDFVIHKLVKSKTLLDDAFIEPPDDQDLETAATAEENGAIPDDSPITVDSYVRWRFRIWKKTLSYYALVLEVIVPGKQIYVSCLRQKPSTSRQDGESWCFPEIPDKSTLDLTMDIVQKIPHPYIDPLKGVYIFN